MMKKYNIGDKIKVDGIDSVVTNILENTITVSSNLGTALVVKGSRKSVSGFRRTIDRSHLLKVRTY